MTISLPDGWPLVDTYDDGLRPAGPPDECFYCGKRIGEPHEFECVIIKRRVEFAVRAELPDGVIATGLWQIDEPYSWEWDKLEFHYNDSTWCASNFLADRAEDGRGAEDGEVVWDQRDDDVDPWAVLVELFKGGDCLCGRLLFKFVRVVDETPRRETHEKG